MAYERAPNGHPPRPIQPASLPLLPRPYYSRLVEELRPLTYSLVGKKTKLMPKESGQPASGIRRMWRMR